MASVLLTSFKPLHLLCKVMLLAPVKERFDPETMEKTYVFREGHYRFNVVFAALVAVGEVILMYLRIQELYALDRRKNEASSGKGKFTPYHTILIFAAYTLSSMVVAMCGVVKSKANFPRLLSLQNILHRIDNELEQPPPPGPFRYVACLYISLNIILRAWGYFVWEISFLGKLILYLSTVSGMMCCTILVMYEDVVCSIHNRFRAINVELRQEMDNFFRQDTLKPGVGRKFKLLPARNVSRERVKELLQLFWLSCRCVQLVNHADGALIFGLIIATTFQLVVIPHSVLITMFTAKVPIPAEYRLWALCDAVWMLLFVCQFFLLVIPPASTSHQGNRTAVIVCQYLSTNTEQNFLEELKSFMFRQNSEIFEFVATHILTLKLPLLTSVIGIIATYLIISIQIRNAILDK